MSFLNKIKGLGRKDSADLDTLEQDRFDEPSGRDDMPLPGAGGTVALDVGAMQATAQMDSSIITEAAPSELAELAEARSAEGPQTQSADSGALLSVLTSAASAPVSGMSPASIVPPGA